MANSRRLQLQLRPLRLLFVAPPTYEAMRPVFEACTMLWGGCYNGILPWHTGEDFPQQAQAYVDAFEPDIVIAADAAHTTQVPLPSHRIQPLQLFFEEAGPRIGRSVLDLYEQLRDSDLRYLHREPARFVALTDDSTDLFAAAWFGRFPDRRFEDAYVRVFGATRLPLVGADLAAVMAMLTPLHAGAYDLQLRGRYRRALMLIDPGQPSDCIDLWNLRAFGVPTHPLLLSEQSKSIPIGRVLARDMTGGSALRLIIGGSIANGTALAFSRALAEGESFEVSLERYDIRAWGRGGASRVRVVAAEHTEECTPRDGQVSFTPLEPHVLPSPARYGLPQWANIVTFAPSSPFDAPAAIPRQADAGKIVDSPHSGQVVISSEGLVALRDMSSVNLIWRVPDGHAVLAGTYHRFRFACSGPGNIAYRILAQLGGFVRMQLLADRRLLNAIEGATRSPAAGGMSYPALLGLEKQIHGDNDLAQRSFKEMIDRGIFQLGLTLQCKECRQSAWHTLDSVSETMRCPRCDIEFMFPTAPPPSPQAWTFRPRGPFAIENHALGSYCVLFALRLLTQTLRSEASWLPSTHVATDDGQQLGEIDFLALWRPEGEVEEPRLLLGECKTYGEFGRECIEKTWALAQRFPHCAIIFATMSDSVAPTDVDALRALAESGRGETAQWPHPVIILTGLELTSLNGPPWCWMQATGRAKEIGEAARGSQCTVLTLASATQAIYLDLAT